MPRPLGFISVNDPDAASVAILPGNGTIQLLEKLFPGTDPGRYNAIAAGNANAINRARQWIPGIENSYVILAALAVLVLAMTQRGGRR